MNQVPMMPIMNQPLQCMPQQQQQKYNAVNIEISNPSVGTPGQNGQGAQTAMPCYTYPQSPVYNYPPATQPIYYPPVAQTPQPMPAPVAPVEPQTTTPVATTTTTGPVQVNYPPVSEPVNATPVPVVPQPEVSTPSSEVAKPEVVQSEEVSPKIDLNAFVARLANPDFDTQSAAMEEIADIIKNSPEKATELVDSKIIDSLVNIVNADSSKLEGPTQEQIAAREKTMSGKEVTDAEKELANTITPKEKAERNKSYALFTTAIIDKLYKDEVAKMQNNTVPMLTELPAVMTIVDNLKDNPNPMVRASAIESLGYLQDPAYKTDLETVFKIAQNDSDPIVANAAKEALAKLN